MMPVTPAALENTKLSVFVPPVRFWMLAKALIPLASLSVAALQAGAPQRPTPSLPVIVQVFATLRPFNVSGPATPLSVAVSAGAALKSNVSAFAPPVILTAPAPGNNAEPVAVKTPAADCPKRTFTAAFESTEL